MKNLSKAQLAQRDELVKRLREAAEEVSKHYGAMEAAITEYNDVVADLEPFRDEITSDMQSYIDERSEKWQEGEKGQAYEEWKGEWENFDVSPIDPLDEPEMEHADTLEQLPEEVPES